MIVEIKGTGSHNKGSEMMLLTILQELKDSSIKFCVAANYQCKYECYSKYELYPKLWLKAKGIQLGLFGKFIPKRLRDIFGIIIDEDVDIILDASGFAYSSQWGIEPTKEMAKNTVRWKKQNKKIILLPQAFGYFEDKKIKKYMKIIIENSNLIFARDKKSYNELMKIKKSSKILLYPDFTNLFKGKKPTYWNQDLEICIVPNKRMKDKKKDSDNYENFLANVIQYFQTNSLKPFFLIHGGHEDEELAKKINSILEKEILIINEENPFFIKGIIANSKGMVGSRFHSLVSALSSNVIAIGTGWSHKYEYLFREYDFEDGFVDVNINFDNVKKRLDLIIKKDKNILKKLKINNERLKNRSKEMFFLLKRQMVL